MSKRLFITRLMVLMAAAVLFTSKRADAQLTGIKTIPGDYATITLAVADVNTLGVGAGGVTFNVAAGYTETITSTISLTATGTAANRIVFQKSGVGANPLITAYTTGTNTPASATQDGIWRLIGSDYVTINGIDLTDPNAANSATMEYGYALYKNSVTDGCQYDTIKNCTITLNRINNAAGTAPMVDGSAGIIVMNATYSAATTNLTPTSSAGTNSFCAFYSNTIQNCNTGIGIIGYAAASPFTLADQGNDVGGTALSTGNTILNYGGGGTTSAAVAIRTLAQYALNVQYNTINSNNGAGVNHAQVLRGILIGTATSAGATINNNTITLKGGGTTQALTAIENQSGSTAASNTININSNTITNCTYTTATSGAFTGILSSSSPTTLNINSNQFTSNATNGTSSATTFISNTGSVATAINMNSNNINGFTYNAANSGALTGISNSSGTGTTTLSINSNNFQALTHSVASSSSHTYIANTSSSPLNRNYNSNTFTNLNVNTTGSITFIADATSVPSGGSLNENSNSIVTAFNKGGAGGTILITTTNASTPAGTPVSFSNNNFSNMTFTGATTFSGYNNTDGGSPIKTINGNTFNNITGGTSGITCLLINYFGDNSSVSSNTVTNITGQSTITGISIGSSGTSVAVAIASNTITGLSSTGTGGSVTAITTACIATTTTVNNNVINNLSSTGASSTVLGIANTGGSTINIYSNAINTLSATGATSPSVYGIQVTSGTSVNVYSNTINTITNSGSSSPVINGILISGGTTVKAYKNKIYDLSESAAIATATGINGILMSGGTTVTTYNNLIGDLRTPAANFTDAIRGISVTSASTATYNVYNNTVYLTASSSGTNFGTTGLYHTTSGTATVGTLDSRNNLIVNSSTPNGTGLAVAYRLSSSTLTNFSANSNNNIYYAGTPGVSRLICYDGTNSYQTVATYKTAMATRDQLALTESNFPTMFLSTTGSNSNFLHILTTTASAIEGSGAPIAAVTDDYDNEARNASTPDVGADEFSGISGAMTVNSVTLTTPVSCAGSSHIVTANITAGINPLTTITLNYSFNAVAQTPIVMTLATGSPASGISTWTATIPIGVPVNATVTYSVTATDGTYTRTLAGTTYQDAPFTGANAIATATPTAVCSGSNIVLSGTVSANGTAQIGAGTSTTSTSGYTPYTGLWEGAKTQYLILASEMTAAGFVAGNITALKIPCTVQGSTTPLLNYKISIGATASTSLTTTFITAGMNLVYSTASLVPAVGTNTYTFISPFNWDGTSNIVVDVCFDNDPGGTCTTFGSPCYGSNSTVQYSTTAFTSVHYTYGDNTTTPNAVRDMCGQTGPDLAEGGSGTTTSRVNFTFDGQKGFAGVTSYTWKEAAVTVGTTNPLTLAPTNVTPSPIVKSYTYTGSDVNGCSVTSPAVNVTVNPLPTAPTATNSTQCGTGVPTASVAGTGTPKWYNQSTGGTLLQASGNTYTTPISVTTTFYVALSNGTCESVRTPVTVTVNQPDVVTATGTSPICLNGVTSLQATKAVGPNNYVYTWTALPVSGSGMPSPVTGASQSITPTAAGTYTYTVTAVDATLGCTTTGTKTVLVNPLPNITSNTATPGTVCSGATVSLAGQSIVPAPGSATIGNGVGSNATNASYGAAYPTYYGNGRQQYLILATELSAAGFVAGNLNSIAFNVTSVTGASPNYVNNYNISLASTALTSITTIQSLSFTNVFSIANYTPTVGVNTHIFSTPFAWDGTSNIIVNICFSDGVTGTTGIQTQQTVMGFNCNAGYYADGNVGDACLSTTNSNLTYTNRPNMTFAGTVVSNLTSNYNWTWNPGSLVGSTVNATTSNPGNTPIVATYTVVATNPTTNCWSSGTVPVTVNPLPTASVSGAVSICSGQSTNIFFTGTPNATVAYTKNAVAQTAITLDATGNYTLNTGALAANTTYALTTVTNPTTTCSQAAAGSVLVTIKPNPTATASSNSAICAGQTLNLTGTSNGTSFQWAGPSYASLAQSPSIVNAQTTASGTYTFTATLNGCSTTSTTAVTVNPNPIAGAGNNGPICAGQTLNLTGVTDIGTSFAWAGPSYSSVSQNPSINNAQALNAGTYTFTATAGSCSTTATTTVTVKPTPTAGASNNGPICAGLTLNLTGTTDVGNSYQWSGPSFTSINQSPSIINAQATATGTYTFTATLNGCSATATTVATVNPLPVLTPTSNTPVCEGLTLNLFGNNDIGTSFTWSGPNGFNSLQQDDNIPNVSQAATGTYTFTATSGLGCSSTGTIFVDVKPLPTANPTSNSPICDGQTLNLSGNTDIGTGFVWAGPNAYNSTSQNPSIAPATVAETGTYTFTATSADGCVTNGTTDVTVNATPTATPGSNSPVCAGQVLNLTGGTDIGTDFAWNGPNAFNSNSQNPTIPGVTTAATGTYTYTATSGAGCSTTATTDVTIIPGPTATISGSTAICPAGTANLNIAFTGTGPWNFTYFDGVGFTNASSATNPYTLPVSPVSTSSYTVTALSDANCTAQPGDLNGTPTVTVNPNGGWTGNVSTDWQTAGNWCGGIPTVTTDVIIPGTVINMPLLNTGTGFTRNLSINSGASVTVAAGGVLEVHGNVVNNGTFDPTGGGLSFNGAAPQTAPAFTTTSLTMNGVSLSTPGDIQVLGSLTMASGDIQMGNNTLTLGKSVLVPGTLNHVSGRIYGYMKRWFNGTNAGNASGMFPFGFNGNDRFITVEYTTAPTSGGTLTGHYLANNNGVHTINNGNPLTITNTAPCIGTFNVVHIDTNIWTIVPADGFTNTGNAANDGLYNVTLQAENQNGYTNVCELTALKSDDNIDWNGDGTHQGSSLVASTVIAKRTGASGWSSWTLGGSDPNPLVIKLQVFTGKMIEKNVSRLDWRVTELKGTEQFEVQRSLDGRSFTAIGTQAAVAGIADYNLYDRNMAKGRNYYRLKTTDIDGRMSYSDVVTLLNTDADAEIVSLAPSVTTGKTTALVQSNISGKAGIKVFDMVGKMIYDMTFKLEKGENHVDFDFSGLASGTYTMHIVLESGMSTPVRFIKQ